MIDHIGTIIGNFDYSDSQAMNAFGIGDRRNRQNAFGKIRNRIHRLGDNANDYIMGKMGLRLNNMQDLM